MIFFHDHIILLLTLIISSVAIFTFFLMANSLTARFTTNAPALEIVWTLIPTLLLIFLIIPSLRLLYLLDELISPAIRLKVIAHQWY